MSLFKSGNPTLSENKFKDTIINIPYADANTMSVRGTLHKFGFMLLMLMGTAFFAWKEVAENGDYIMPMVYGGAIGGFIIALIITFKREWAPYLAPLYALLEGLFIGAISAMFNDIYDGIVMSAVGLTFGVSIAMYLLYSFRIIKATEKFKSIIFTATAGIAIFYFITWIVGMFGVNMPFMYDNSMLSIGISLFIVGIAALNLILDFDMIEQGANMGAPKYMEWYGAFGLMVTIVWLYLEILRLLAKLNSRD